MVRTHTMVIPRMALSPQTDARVDAGGATPRVGVEWPQPAEPSRDGDAGKSLL